MCNWIFCSFVFDIISAHVVNKVHIKIKRTGCHEGVFIQCVSIVVLSC